MDENILGGINHVRKERKGIYFIVSTAIGVVVLVILSMLLTAFDTFGTTGLKKESLDHLVNMFVMKSWMQRIFSSARYQ